MLIHGKLFKKGKQGSNRKWLLRDFEFDRETRVLCYSYLGNPKGAVLVSNLIAARIVDNTTDKTDNEDNIVFELYCNKIEYDGTILEGLRVFTLATKSTEDLTYWLRNLNTLVNVSPIKSPETIYDHEVLREVINNTPTSPRKLNLSNNNHSPSPSPPVKSIHITSQTTHFETPIKTPTQAQAISSLFTPPSNAVSLSMPVESKSYISETIPLTLPVKALAIPNPASLTPTPMSSILTSIVSTPQQQELKPSSIKSTSELLAGTTLSIKEALSLTQTASSPVTATMPVYNGTAKAYKQVTEPTGPDLIATTTHSSLPMPRDPTYDSRPPVDEVIAGVKEPTPRTLSPPTTTTITVPKSSTKDYSQDMQSTEPIPIPNTTPHTPLLIPSNDATTTNINSNDLSPVVDPQPTSDLSPVADFQPGSTQRRTSISGYKDSYLSSVNKINNTSPPPLTDTQSRSTRGIGRASTTLSEEEVLRKELTQKLTIAYTRIDYLELKLKQSALPPTKSTTTTTAPGPRTTTISPLPLTTQSKVTVSNITTAPNKLQAFLLHYPPTHSRSYHITQSQSQYDNNNTNVRLVQETAQQLSQAKMRIAYLENIARKHSL